jgi:hypothetical protein
MSSKKKLNREATIQNILKAAEGNIKDMDAFNELMKNEEDILDSAMLWDAEIIYE